MHLVNNSIVKDHPTFYQKNEELQTRGLMWFRQDFERWLHSRSGCTGSTPFLTPPPYTCSTYGVDFSKLADKDKAFQESEEDDGVDSDENEEQEEPLSFGEKDEKEEEACPTPTTSAASTEGESPKCAPTTPPQSGRKASALETP